MELFYTPQHARVGDVIPFYEDGVFKPFYLKNWNPYFGDDRRHGWHMLTTADHLHYAEQPTGILGGTGSVIKVDGVYHLYYCVFEHDPQRQYVCHAVSKDGMKTWEKLPEETFGADENIYLPTDWRDPYVFWNEEEKRWWMILCAQAKGATARRGCVGLCVSDDLHHWKAVEPIFAPQSNMSAYECPDLFRMGDWWYLVCSQFTDRFQVIYRMAKSPRGPWIRPDVDSFDGRAFYAAKTGTDGKDRFIYGWNPSRTQDHYGFNPNEYSGYDYNTYDWGGSLVVHKLVQHEDGTLGVCPIDALDQALTIPNALKWEPLNGDWKQDGSSFSVSAPQSYASVMTRNEVPQCGHFHASFRFEEGTERLAIALQVDERFAKGYYFYFDPKRQRVEYKSALRMTENGGWTFQYDVELERPLELKPGKWYDVDLYLDDTVMVLYVNHDTALSVRKYDLFARKFGLAVSDGSVEFGNLQLTTKER